MTSLGVASRPQIPPERLRAVATTADDAGLEELWLWEDCFFEGGISAASAALACTDRLAVGIGLLPVPLRNVALTAMEIATVERMFPGRFRPGVGHGVQEWMGQVGARVESPLTLLREHLTATRALLRGEKVTTSGRYVTLDGVALDWPPAQAPAILAGAVGPKTLRLAGEAADGTILDGSTTAEQLRRARQLIDEGRAAAGRTDHHHIVVFMTSATGPGSAARLRAENESFGHQDKPDLGIAGDAAAFAAAAETMASAGADSVIFVPTADEPDIEGFVRFVAGEVRPLVR
jgi:alkanesulfonate monooxygenase SsuD/methylene tetrahydromethanopterin reductase-like flavin-dependent oxidoreductase (luciferase family)